MNERRKKDRCPSCSSEFIILLAKEVDVDRRPILKCQCNECRHVFLRQRSTDTVDKFWTEAELKAEWR